MTVNTDVQALIDKAVFEAEAATITYASWHDRVVSGWYASRKVDPYTQTAWGRFLAAAQNAKGLLNTTTPPPTSTPLLFDDGFSAAATQPPPTPPAGATWPTMPTQVPKLAGFAYVQPYTWPAISWQPGLTGKALRLRLTNADTIAKLGGSNYSWGTITNGAEATLNCRWLGKGYRLGQTDFYGFRVRFVSVSDCYSFVQLGYPVVHYSNIALRCFGGELGLNQESGFSPNPSPGYNEKSIVHKNITPGGGKIVAGRWYDVAVKVRWATDATGELAVWTRTPETDRTWLKVHDETDVPTQQWGNTIDGKYVNKDGTNTGGTPRAVDDKLSLYRGVTAGQPDLTVDYNRFVVGDSFAAVDAALA